MDARGFASSFRRFFPDVLGQRVLVALSGGADSVALLHLLVETQPELGCPVAACHVNHHARPEADEDERFCAALCADLGVELRVHHLREHAPHGVSREAWWRRRRYEGLELARLQLRCTATATAHTRDDQAETVLLKLVRGSGPRGVIGVRRRDGVLVRPLLDLGRDELRASLRAEGRCWQEDAGNTNLDQPRAWVRLVGLPALESRFGGIAKHFAAFAECLADDEAVLADLASSLPLPEVGRPVAQEDVARAPSALRRRWLLALAAELPLGEPPSRTQVEAVMRLVAEGRPAAVDLGRRWVVRCRAGRIGLTPPPLVPFLAWPAAVPSVHTVGGYPRVSIDVRLEGSDRIVHEVVLARRLRDARLCWRPPRGGEVAAWPSVRGKIAHLLRNAGVPAEWRRAWPLLEADGRMIWIPGVGAAPEWAGEPGLGIVAALEEPWRRHVR